MKNWVDLSNSGQQKIDSLSAEVRLLKEQLDSIAREKQLIENEVPFHNALQNERLMIVSLCK